MFLLLSNFGLHLSSLADFLITEARAPTSAECLPAQRTMQFGHMV